MIYFEADGSWIMTGTKINQARAEAMARFAPRRTWRDFVTDDREVATDVAWREVNTQASLETA